MVEEGGLASSEAYILVKSVTGILMEYGYKRHSPWKIWHWLSDTYSLTSQINIYGHVYKYLNI